MAHSENTGTIELRASTGKWFIRLGEVDDFGTFKWLESIPYSRLLLPQIKAFLQPSL